jgi:hypothetical protein
MFAAADRHDHLVQIPDVACAWRLATQAADVARAEFLRLQRIVS